MSKQIVIVGGGVSGLTLLHYLKKKYFDDPQTRITLLEKNDFLGGTIRTIKEDGCLFETGPNGFLDSKPSTLELIRELNCDQFLVKAKDSAKDRYISLHNKLYAFPLNPEQYFRFPLLTMVEKFSVIKELFVKKGDDPSESVFAFWERRLGRRFADIFIDTMVSGIYGGDARQLVLKEAFPRLYNLEQEYGSILKGFYRIKKKRSKEGTTSQKSFKGALTTFQKGMSQFMDAFQDRYKDNLSLDQDIERITYKENMLQLFTKEKEFDAHELYLSVPAYAASSMLFHLSPSLAEALQNINYAPIVVVGLVYSKDDFVKEPQGFGYLIPTSENKPILGVLFESELFPDRTPDGRVLLRIMLGGVKHPEVIKMNQEELIHLAKNEIALTLGVNKNPMKIFCTRWTKAIPQYDMDYMNLKEKISKELMKWPQLHLVANYWGGVSFNDCIERACQIASQSNRV